MRLRVKGVSYKPFYIELWYPLTNDWEKAVNTVIVLPKGYSQIADNLGHKVWQPASHHRISHVPGDIGSVLQHEGSTMARSPCAHYMSLTDMIALSDAILQASRGGSYEVWVSGLYFSFTDQFPNECSLANTLIELRNGVKEFLPTLEDLRSKASSDFLKFKFGIQPFIKDIKDMCGVYGAFHKRLKFLRENQKIFIDKRKLVSNEDLVGSWEGPIIDWTYQKPSTPRPFPLPPLVNPAVHHRLRTEADESWSEVKHYATAVIDNQITNLDNVSLQVAAFLGMAGFSNPTQVFWNAVPFTWLADWFVDIGSMLTPLETQPFEGKLALQATYITTKVRSAWEVLTRCPDDNFITTGEKGNILFRRYERSGKLEVAEGAISPKLIAPSLFSADQGAILLALLDQRCAQIPNFAETYKSRLRKLPWRKVPWLELKKRVTRHSH